MTDDRMKPHTSYLTRRSTFAIPAAAILAAALLLTPVTATSHPTVLLGNADPFAILAGAGITNIGATTVTGDVGSHPTPSQTGFGPGANSVTITGTNHHDDAVTQAAKDALVTAYDDAAGRPLATPIAGGELGNRVLEPGVYTDDNAPDSLAITGTLTLDGLNDPDSVFIFQSGSTLVTASNSNVVLINGAQACNVFWQVTSSATLGTGSHLEGTVMALSSITLDNSATVNGRVLARNGAVTMDTNTIQIVPCVSPPVAPPPASPPPASPPPASPPPASPPPASPPPAVAPPPAAAPSATPTSSPAAETSPAPTPPSAIPFFPSTTALVVAAVAGLGGTMLILGKRRK